jgi:hypothetical protein
LFHTPKANAAALKAAKKAAKKAATKAAVPNNGTVAISSVVKPRPLCIHQLASTADSFKNRPSLRGKFDALCKEAISLKKSEPKKYQIYISYWVMLI